MSFGLRPPLPESYWVLPGRFLAGEHPAQFGNPQDTERLDDLLNAGIDSFFDLTQPGELPAYVPLLQRQAGSRGIRVNYRSFPILDRGLPKPAQMLKILDSIDAALGVGQGVYLHCWGGVGRTGLTVGCYLVRHGRTGTEALRQIAEWWRSVPKRRYHPRSPETPQQVKFVLDWREPPWTANP